MRQTHNKGLIGILVIIVLAIITLSYFNIDLQKVANEPSAEKNIEYVTEQTTTFWKAHLEKPFNEFWKTVVVGELWNTFKKSIEETTKQPIAAPAQQPLPEIQ